MKKPIKNIEQSVRDRLKRLQQETGRPLNFYLRLFMQQGLLNRLSRSSYNEYFVLKGGLFLFSRIGLHARPTQDIDFLGRNISNNDDRILKAFREICQINCEDGLRFELASITIEAIAEEAEYNGRRVRITCYLGVMRDYIKIDIGFGDIVVPRPQVMTFPSILDDLVDSPEVICYSIDSVIAEKLEAAIKRDLLNGRMKDFFDIYTLIKHYRFDGRVLQEAIFQTFNHRNTPIKRELIIFSEEFRSDPAILSRWKAFLIRLGQQGLKLTEVLNTIQFFISPVWDKICDDDEFFGSWNCETQHWKPFLKSTDNDQLF
jgi:predicted nucleotidyltransferase component of viral defense system